LRKSNTNIPMHSKIDHLSTEEQKLVINAPILVTALISGADGDFHIDEIRQAVKIIHIKTYSETRDVSGVYKSIDGHTEEMIDDLISHLPKETLDRNHIIIDQLKGLNRIFPKLDTDFANDLFVSLKELAYYVSNAGNMGIDFHSEQEKMYVKLDFLQVNP
jgi:hypothetical protein